MSSVLAGVFDSKIYAPCKALNAISLVSAAILAHIEILNYM